MHLIKSCFKLFIQPLIAVLFILTVLNVSASALYKLDLPAELAGSTFKSETRLKNDGSFFGRSTIKYEKKTYKGKDYLVISADSSGKLNGKPFTSELEKYYFLDAGKITSYSLKGTTRAGGKLWTESSIDYDWTNMTATVNYRDYQKNENISKSVPIQRTMIAVQDLELYITTMPKRGVKSESLKALLPNGGTFGFLVNLKDGTETVTVNGVPVTARRIELKPDLGLISYIIPNVNYWVRAVSPYDLVRYSGLISGPGSPDVVQEIYRAD